MIELIAPYPPCASCRKYGMKCHHLRDDASQAEQEAWAHGYEMALLELEAYKVAQALAGRKEHR